LNSLPGFHIMLCGTVRGVLRQVGLLDNITEHLDVIEAFQLMLHRKRGRLGPAQHSNAPATASQGTGPAPAAGGGAGHQQPGSPSASLEPPTLTVVHVLRPGQLAAAAAALPQAEACLAGSRPCSPGPPERDSTAGSRPESRGKFGQRAISRAAAAASGMDSITTLDAGEVLELLLLVRGLGRCGPAVAACTTTASPLWLHDQCLLLPARLCS
jgi:hypothetical protein